MVPKSEAPAAITTTNTTPRFQELSTTIAVSVAASYVSIAAASGATVIVVAVFTDGAVVDAGVVAAFVLEFGVAITDGVAAVVLV
jgi:hypothetical protein